MFFSIHIRGSYFRRIIFFPVLIAFLSGCGFSDLWKPDQSGFEPLTSLASNGQAVARVYAAPLPVVGALFTHTWLAVKAPDVQTFDRWEVWIKKQGPYGFVQKNLLPVERDLAGGSSYVVAELIGTEAEGVVSFVETRSPNYPYKDVYVAIPGPNSDTYTQWVLNSTRWDVQLPGTALGKDYQPNPPLTIDPVP
ncbi:MAG: DUF3750 domain-containing protein [Phycisphaerae bacterium]